MYAIPPIPLKEKEFLDGWKKWLKKLVDAFDYIRFTGIETSGNIFLSDSDNGIILTSPDGTYWLIQVDNTGALTINSETAEDVAGRFRRGRA